MKVTDEELQVIRATCYVLKVVKIYILTLEDPKVASGVMVVRIMQELVNLLDILSKSQQAWSVEDHAEVMQFEKQLGQE